MTPVDRPQALVIHPGGALGDFVLTWPAVRSLLAAGLRVGTVSASSRTHLARRVLGVAALPDHLPPWTALWAGEAPAETLPEVRLVLAFGDRPEPWRRAMGEACPQATVIIEPRALDRRVALETASRFGGGPGFAPLRCNQSGPVVLHAGAGDASKAWPLDRWVEVSGALRARGHPSVLAAGEVERERWPLLDRNTFLEAGGEFVPDLDRLVDLYDIARAVVAADTGPGHLAAQLGLPTITLFGPTDPERWAPIGPRTWSAPAPNSRMADLKPDQVLGAVETMLNRPPEPPTR